MQRALALEDHALGADRAVELVLDLQQAGGELAVIVAVADADRLVGRIGFGESLLQRRRIASEVVVAHRERGLHVALVAQPAHAQRGRVGQVERVLAQALELVRAACHEARANRRRGAEEIEEQPGMAPEIADQREIRLAGKLLGHRKVVVDAGDHLHAPAVAMRKTHPVDILGATDVGGTVAAERDGIVRRKAARHARAPEQFVADRAIDRLVNCGEVVEAGLRAAMHPGDELELRLAEVGGYARVGERRAEPRRMRRGGQRAVGPHAQALLFDAASKTRQHGRWERAHTRESAC